MQFSKIFAVASLALAVMAVPVAGEFTIPKCVDTVFWHLCSEPAAAPAPVAAPIAAPDAIADCDVEGRDAKDADEGYITGC